MKPFKKYIPLAFLSLSTIGMVMVMGVYIQDTFVPIHLPDSISSYTEKILANPSHIHTILTSTEYSTNSIDNTIHTWHIPVVTVAVHGNARASDFSCLNSTINDFNTLSNTTQLRIAKDYGAIDMFFDSIDKFPSIEPHYVPNNDGFFWYYWNDTNEIIRSTILIRTDSRSSLDRCHMIREELTQSMGMPGDSNIHSDSIFFDGPSTSVTYSNLDKAIIQSIYNTSMYAGMTWESYLSIYGVETPMHEKKENFAHIPS